MNELLDAYTNHRPILHYSVPHGWMNDPNGLIFENGWYHLFYQHYPDGLQFGPMHWGHARSCDLLHWETLPIALYPDKNGVTFSGSVVADTQNTAGFAKDQTTPLVAVYTSHKDVDGQVTQSQSLAFSYDSGYTFEKYAKNPVLGCNLRDFRDPKVIWHEESKQWVMPLAAGRKVMLYGSKNLRDWNYLSTFESKNPTPEGIWECPDLHLIQAEDGSYHWVLLVSVNVPDESCFGIQYFIGNFDGRMFHSETPEQDILMLDFGIDNYAAVTFNGVSDRVILIGWMNCWYYGDRIPASTFRGSMTIPRELKLRHTTSGWRLLQQPVRELFSAFDKAPSHEYQESALLQGPLLIAVQIRAEKETISLENEKAAFVIQTDTVAKTIRVDRSGCGHEELGKSFLATRTGHYFSDQPLQLYILIDVTSVEIFAANGEAVGTFQYFIDKPFTKISTENRNTSYRISQLKSKENYSISNNGRQ
jgi:fructan beta-fructosidase